METHIYISTDTAYMGRGPKGYGYIIEARTGKRIVTREGYGTMTGTYHEAVLTALSAALGHFTRPSEVHIHMEDEFVCTMYRKLPDWAEKDFRTISGKPLANRDRWAEIWQKSSQHTITTEAGGHAYTRKIREGIERRK